VNDFYLLCNLMLQLCSGVDENAIRTFMLDMFICNRASSMCKKRSICYWQSPFFKSYL